MNKTRLEALSDGVSDKIGTLELKFQKMYREVL